MTWTWPHPDEYAAARPFPHAVFDEFIGPDWAADVADEFPDPDDERWHHFSAEFENKYQVSDTSAFGPSTLQLFRWLTSPGITRNVAKMVGTDHLRGSVYGGGYHLIRPGGFLGMHTDSLHDPDGEHWETEWYRCVNLLVFLTDNEGDATADLWLAKRAVPDQQEPPHFITPKPGRAAIFTTTGDTLHGHPTPLEYQDRRSFACYYYREHPPPWWTGDQPTSFVP